MFKNLILYRLADDCAMPTGEGLEKFAPCGPTQQASAGFVEPRGIAHGAMIESVGGALILKIAFEARNVPAATVAKRVDELADKIEQQTGRKPSRKERRDLKEEALLELLPQAFTRQTAVMVWIDQSARILAIGASGARRADDVVSLLVRSIPGFNVRPLQTAMSPSSGMSAWLLEGEAEGGFTLGRECELKACDEMRAAVRYTKHALDLDQIRDHVKAGKAPTRLALNYLGRVDFTLTDSLQLKKIVFDDIVFESSKKDTIEETFDADVAIATGELGQAIKALIEALGGELEIPDSTASSGPTSDGEDDELLDQAIAIVKTQKKASISLVQRHLRIGYNRAARLLETMEKRGIVSPMGSDGARKLTTET